MTPIPTLYRLCGWFQFATVIIFVAIATLIAAVIYPCMWLSDRWRSRNSGR